MDGGLIHSELGCERENTQACTSGFFVMLATTIQGSLRKTPMGNVSMASTTLLISVLDQNDTHAPEMSRHYRKYLTGRHSCLYTYDSQYHHTTRSEIAGGANGLHPLTRNLILRSRTCTE
jgi:hypothetical protein